jgi:hypothetical protein
MTSANANTSGVAVIQFNINGSGVQTITPASLLPFLTKPTIIDGWSQGGLGYTGPPLIEINGGSAGLANGFEVRGGNSTIRGLIINRFAYAGIVLETNGNNVVQGNYIGTGSTGTNALGNGSAGITVTECSSNLIGGTSSSTRNVICGNFGGVWLLGGGFNQVQGNYIGIDASGTRGLANQGDGVSINALYGTFDYSHDCTIGGSDPGARNLISGNAGHGISIYGTTVGPARNQILGNYIGPDRTGSF